MNESFIIGFIIGSGITHVIWRCIYKAKEYADREEDCRDTK
jgi:hypothetical protein